MVQLALIRHGHTSWNRAGRIQGRTDIELDDQARSELQGKCLPAPWDKAAIVASPLARAVETAQLISGRVPEHIPDLIEMDWGDWEGKRGKDLLADPDCAYCDLESWGFDFYPPNGEAIQTVSDRVLGWAARLNQDTLAVCHIGVMRVLLAEATGWSFKGPAPFSIKRNRLYVISDDADGWRMQGNPVPLDKVATCA